MPLEIAYSPLLVAGSLAVAIMASFTALRLTSNLRHLTIPQRKFRITQGALALGIGIWSMHFVGMLAVQLPITISYNPLATLGSALIAVLVTGSALLALHFGVRTRARIIAAGTLTGLGIVSMHYLGMSAISANCIVTHSMVGMLVATGIGIAVSIFAMDMAYGNRDLKSTITGSVALGLAISAMHYSAMYFTEFAAGPELPVAPIPLLSTHALALVVALSSFVVCGLFLLSAVPGSPAAPADENIDTVQIAETGHPDAISGAVRPARRPAPILSRAASDMRIPYEQENATRFVVPSEIMAVQADGHYTRLHKGRDELFCPWSISRIEKSLNDSDFIRTHRSFIVNKQHISGFRRDGDKAVCLIGNDDALEIPVSRSRVNELRKYLSLEPA